MPPSTDKDFANFDNLYLRFREKAGNDPIAGAILMLAYVLQETRLGSVEKLRTSLSQAEAPPPAAPGVPVPKRYRGQRPN